MRFAVSTSVPAAMATVVAAVIDFTFKVNGGLSGEITHWHVVLFDTLLIRKDFHIADCAAETVAIEYVD